MKMKKLISTLLCTAMISSALPTIGLAANDNITNAKGSIKATLRFDYPQYLSKVKEQNINVKIFKDNKIIGDVPFDGEITGEAGDKISASKRNTDGGEIINESEIGYFDINISDLELGNYSFAFEGDGYTKYKTPSINLNDYSKHIILGTGDTTFSIGDVNNDGKVNTKDRSLLSDALGKNDSENLSLYDLNGDGRIDIADLAYVNHQLSSEGNIQVFDSSLISQKIIDTNKITGEINVTGNINNIFSDNNTSSVTINPKNENEDISIPIEFNKKSEMEQIEIISPSADGAVTAGNAIVTYEDSGKEITEEFSFDNSVPDGVELLSAREGTSSVVISLGKRVAVKKIIINVEKVEGKDGKPTFAVIQEIKFLKDIVPENPEPQSLSVKNVKAFPKNESVQLTWNEFPNITGYTIYYGLENGVYDSQLTVDTNSALITGLKNLKTYYFTVVPISEGWSGSHSETVSAVPQPNSRPLKPDMVTITPMDSALAVSWKAAENAVYYRVFYKEKESDDFIEFGDKITSTSVNIGNLINDKEYLIYIIAGNDIGEGPQSDMAEGIPKKIVIEAPEIPTLHMIDKSNIESVEMYNPNNVNQNEYPNGFNVWNVADGDYGTHWTARAFWESNQFTFTFKEAKEMNYMVYIPRLDGNYRKSLEKYTITVWDEEGNQKNLVEGKNIPINSNETGYMILPFERTKVKKLAVSLAQWAGSPTGVSLAEAVFYESDDLASEVRALFANDIYTELSDTAKSNIDASKKKIAELRSEANNANGYYVDKDVLLDELDLAEALLDGDNNKLGCVKIGVESRNSGTDSAKYSQAGSDLQPLGVVAYATNYAERQKFEQTKVTVYAHIPDGESAYIVPTQYYAEANAWQGAGIALQNGRNIIEIPQLGTQTSERGGALYLKYSGKNPQEISLQIRQGALSIPTLQLSDWYSISDTERKSRIDDYVSELETHVNSLNKNNISLRILNSTEISMPNVLLSVAADRVLGGIKPSGAGNDAAAETLYNNVLAWEDLMHIVNTTQGIDNTLENSDMQSRQNIRYMRMFAKAFMYAAGNHIGIGYGSVSGMVCGKPISMLPEGAAANNLFGWGIAHEIGHNMDKIGKAEITNNIYSLMAQTYDGKENTLKSRLELSDKYKTIYDKVSSGRPGMSNDVFTQLGMYWQLHLAYDDGDAPMDFYNRFFKEWKSGNITAATSDERFALVSAKIANKNLTEFFERWGMKLSDDTKSILSNYPEETRSIYYLNDDSRRYRLNGGNTGIGETSAKAQVNNDNEKQVDITFSNTADPDTVLGYEIARNGIAIAFTKNSEYTDTIGSANNKAYSYTVQAIDKLGNKIGDAADAGEIRISYVRTIDADKYELTRNDDNSINVLMKEKTAVSGLKITNAPDDGEFSVSVKQDNNEEFVIAKSGDFAKNETPDADYYVTYFNKPKTSADDTRIWTYDASEINITGIPDNVNVEFISYAGDNIEFNTDATVGRLSNDYVYGDDEGEVITAGTLIVTGKYRGDPMYNTVQIQGRFINTDPETNEQVITERAISGYSLLFAEIPEDGKVSDISDGIFIFVPDIQNEAELQGDINDCSAESLMPAQIKAELYRTDTAESADSSRLTSDTIWIDSPSDSAMPEIIIE